MEPEKVLGQLLNDVRIKAVLSIDELVNCGNALRAMKTKLDELEDHAQRKTTERKTG